MAIGEVAIGCSLGSLLIPIVKPLSLAEFKVGIQEKITQPPLRDADCSHSDVEPPQKILRENRPDDLTMYFHVSENSTDDDEEELEGKEEQRGTEEIAKVADNGLTSMEHCSDDSSSGECLYESDLREHYYAEDNNPSALLFEESIGEAEVVQLHPEEDAIKESSYLEDIADVEHGESRHGSDSDPELIVGAAEAAIAAERVRAMAAETIKEAWENLRQEFEVQVLIWSNMLSMGAAGYNVRANRKAHETMCAFIREGMELAELEVSRGVCDKSRQKLEAVLVKDVDYGGLLNHSTKASILAVIKAQDLMTRRLELARCLDVSTSGQVEAITEDDHLHLGTLIESCDLGDLGLVYRARRVLGLSMGRLMDMSLEEEEIIEGTVTPPNEGELDPWAVGGTLDMTWGSRRGWRNKVDKLRSRGSRSSRGSKSSSSMSGRSVESHGSSRSSRSRKSSVNEPVPETDLLDAEFPRTMPISVMKERHYREAVFPNTCKGTPAQGMETGVLGMPGPPDVAPWITEVSNTPINVQANDAAEKVRNLALEGLEDLWDDVRQEFEVQLLVWGSLALVQGSSVPNARVRGAFDAALKSADIAALESLIQKHSGHLSKATLTMSRNLVEAEALAKLRRELANSLEVAGRAAFAGDIWEPGPELENRIKSCQLKDLGIEYSVRRVLGLSVGGDFRDRWKKYRHIRKGKMPRDLRPPRRTSV